MKCTRCGAEAAEGQKFCKLCGGQVALPPKTAVVMLTEQESILGCKKMLRLPDMPQPVVLQLNPGIRDGQQMQIKSLRFTNAQGQEEERALLLTFRVQVEKKKKKSAGWILPVVLLLCLAIGAAVFYKPLSRLLDTTPTLTEEQIRQEAREQIPHFDRRYLLQQLETEDLQVLCAIYKNAMAFETNCALPKPLSLQELTELTALLTSECPELFQLDFTQEIVYVYDSEGKLLSFTMPYCLEENRYRAMRRDCEEVIETLVEQAEGLHVAEKEKLAFDYLALHCWYDLENSQAGNAYGALVETAAKCDGIALAYKWILEEMGMQTLCIYADSRYEDIGHAWNMVCLDDRWCHVDVTQSVCRKELPEELNRQVIYTYYNVSDGFMAQLYEPYDLYDTLVKLPSCPDMDNSYYVRAGLFVAKGQDGESLFADALNRAQEKGDSFLVIQFEDMAEFDAFLARLATLLPEYLQGYAQTIHYYSLGEHTCVILL